MRSGTRRRKMVLVRAREERLAQNEALFREVNERVAEVARHFIEVETKGEAVEFICECGRARLRRADHDDGCRV